MTERVRTQIYLDPHQHNLLVLEARKRGISLAELVRRIVGEHWERKPSAALSPNEVLLGIVGLGSSGIEDVSDRHDQYLGEALP